MKQLINEKRKNTIDLSREKYRINKKIFGKYTCLFFSVVAQYGFF